MTSTVTSGPHVVPTGTQRGLDQAVRGQGDVGPAHHGRLPFRADVLTIPQLEMLGEIMDTIKRHLDSTADKP